MKKETVTKWILGLTLAFAFPTVPARAIDIAEDFENAVDPSTFTITGNAFQDLANGYLVATPLGAYKRGSFFWNETVPQLTYFEASFDFWIGGGSAYLGGADGLTFAFVPGPTLLGNSGGDLGYSGMGGYAFEIDTYYNGEKGDPNENHVAIVKGSANNHLVKNTAIPEIEDAGWFHCDIFFAYGHIQVFLSNDLIGYPLTQVIDFTIPNYQPFDALLGFTASSGAGWNDHLVDNVYLSTVVGCPPEFATRVESAVLGSGASTDPDAPLNALGVPDNQFYALGNAGSIVVAFENTCIQDGIGKDLLLYEALGGVRERADVYVSIDGTEYSYLGEANGTTALDLAASGRNCVRFVQIVDKDDRRSGGGTAGYDLDAVQALHQVCSEKIPVIVIPGIYGTYLYNNVNGNSISERDPNNVAGDELIWLDDEVCCNELDEYLQVLALQDDGSPLPNPCDTDPTAVGSCLDIHAGPIMREERLLCKSVLPDLLATDLDFYGPLEKALAAHDFQVYPFPYDWRRDLNETTATIQELVTQIRSIHGDSTKVHIVAHSMGGLAARAYARANPGDVDTIVFLGTPHLGAAQAYRGLVRGELDNAMDIVLDPSTVRSLAPNWPGAHELLPSQAYSAQIGNEPLITVQLDDNSTVNVPLEEVYGLTAPSQLAPEEVVPNTGLNTVALDFHDAIADQNDAARMVSFVTDSKATLWRYHRDKNGVITGVFNAGDGTVPLPSAAAPFPGEHYRYYTTDIEHSDFPKNSALAEFIGRRLKDGAWSATTLPADAPAFLHLVPENVTEPTAQITTLGPTTWDLESCTGEAGRHILEGGLEGFCEFGPWPLNLPSVLAHVWERNEDVMLYLTGCRRIHIIQCESGFLNMVFRICLGEDVCIGFSFLDIPFPFGTDGYITLPPDGSTPWIDIDYDGDGTFETRLYPVPLPAFDGLPAPGIPAYEGDLFQYNLDLVPTFPGIGVQFRLIEGPAGMTIDPLSGLITWIAICGDHTVVVEAEQESGEVTQGSFDVHVEDTTPPSITAPPPIEQPTRDPAGVPREEIDLGFPEVSDGCCAEIEVTNDAPAIFPVDEPRLVTWTATDCNGHSNSDDQWVTVNLIRNQPPTAVAQAPETVECTGNGEAPVALDGGGSTDPDGAADLVSYVWTEGSTTLGTGATLTVPLAVGTHTITLTVTDAGDLSHSDTVVITVVDTRPPDLIPPLPVVWECGPIGELGWPTVSDVCCTEIMVSPPVFLMIYPVLPVGQHEVIWTATDCAGNTTTAAQQVTVVDTTSPTIMAPGDLTVQCAGPDGTPVDLGLPVADDICGPVTVLNDAPALFKLGTTTVTWTATDAAGNTATVTQDVTVVDTKPPVVSGTVAPNLLWPPNHKLVEVTPSFTITDQCDGDITQTAPLTLLNVTMNEGEETLTFDPAYDTTLGDGHTLDDIQVTEDGRVFLRAERSGKGTGRVYTLTYQATDASGNSTTATTTVTVPHEAP